MASSEERTSAESERSRRTALTSVLSRFSAKGYVHCFFCTYCNIYTTCVAFAFKKWEAMTYGVGWGVLNKHLVSREAWCVRGCVRRVKIICTDLQIWMQLPLAARGRLHQFGKCCPGVLLGALHAIEHCGVRVEWGVVVLVYGPLHVCIPDKCPDRVAFEFVRVPRHAGHDPADCTHAGHSSVAS